jgi:hypothetical protein
VKQTRKSIARAPAFQALVIQCTSFLIVFMAMPWMHAMVGITLPVVLTALLQGAFAAAVSYWLRLARWWLYIQFLFPCAVIAMQSLQLPSVFYLTVFILLAGLYWSTFRTQVPFYPSNQLTWDAVAALLPQSRGLQFIDIGSGMGGLVLDLAARRPDSDISGIEVAPLAWLVSLLRARISASRAHFVRGDYERLNFGQYDVVFAYLSPAAMPRLWYKAQAEMRSGTLLLSYEFAIPDVHPHIHLHADPNGPILYGWHM